jgi:hypothetical protein
MSPVRGWVRVVGEGRNGVFSLNVKINFATLSPLNGLLRVNQEATVLLHTLCITRGDLDF